MLITQAFRDNKKVMEAEGFEAIRAFREGRAKYKQDFEVLKAIEIALATISAILISFCSTV